MPVYHKILYLHNLPYDISNEDLKEQVVKLFHEVLESDSEGVKVRVLPRTSTTQWAMVFDCKITPKMLQLLQLTPFIVKKIDGRRVFERDALWHEDSFVKYDSNWTNPQAVFSCVDLRLLKSSLFGINYRKVTFALDQEFLSRINLKLWDPNSKTVKLDLGESATEKSVSEWKGIFGKSSYSVTSIDRRNSERAVVVRLGSELDALQCISKLNLNENLLGARLYFIPLSGPKFDRNVTNRQSIYDDKLCLGTGGKIIKTFDLMKKYGYIPCNSLDSFAVRFEQINTLMKTKGPSCIFCNGTYEVIGILPDFSCLCAECSGCKYSSESDQPASSITNGLEKTSPARGVWNEEPFTRIVVKMQQLAPSDRYLPIYVKNLFVTHEPLQLTYEDVNEYSKISATLLKQEHEYITKIYAASSIHVAFNRRKTIKHLGRLQPPVSKFGIPTQKEADKIEYFLNQKICREFQKDQAEYLAHASLFLLEVKIPFDAFSADEPDDYWDEKSLQYVLINGYEQFQKTRGKVVFWKTLFDEKNYFLHLGIHFAWTEETDPDVMDIETIEPFPDIASYHYWLETLESFADQDAALDLVDVFLGKQRPGLFQQTDDSSWAIPELADDVNLRQSLSESLFNGLSLDSSQLAAIEAAEHQQFSVIDGAAGTGKTALIPVLAYKSLLTSGGRILILTERDKQADAVAMAIHNFQLNKTAFDKICALRVHSENKKRSFLDRNSDLPSFPCLYSEVRKHETWKWLEEQLGELDYQRWRFNASKLRIIANHERYIETKILEKPAIIVTTLHCLMNARFEDLDSCFSTVIFDSAENILEHKMLEMFKIRPQRCVVIGDFSHPVPKCQHFGNHLSGFDRTLGERAVLVNLCQNSVGRPEIFPITKLTLQHRMDESISNLVSHLFYQDQLKCSQLLKSRRRPQYETDMINIFPQLKQSRVLFVDSGEPPARRDNEVMIVLEIVTKLLKTHVPACRITILLLNAHFTTLVKQKLEKYLDSDCAADAIKVSYVDRSTCQENDVIIVMCSSFSKSIPNDGKADDSKMLLAYSMAKYALFVVGGRSVFTQSDSRVCKRFCNKIINPGYQVNTDVAMEDAKE